MAVDSHIKLQIMRLEVAVDGSDTLTTRPTDAGLPGVSPFRDLWNPVDNLCCAQQYERPELLGNPRNAQVTRSGSRVCQ